MKSLLLALVLLSPLARAENLPAGCSPLDTPMPNEKGEVCVYPGTANSDVLYYLHGLNGGAEGWAETNFWSEQIRDYWKEHGLAAPTIVSVSLGQVWLLAPKTTAPASGLLPYFTDKVMPEIEAKLGGVKGRRIILGDSMGGFNAIQLGLKTQLFAKVAALCAEMADGVGPFSSDDDVNAYIRNSTAVKSGKHSFEELRNFYDLIRGVVKYFWATPEEWQGSEPIGLARSFRAPSPVSFYLAAGYFDHYMTYEGNVAFAKALAQSGTKVEWRPQWGDHCAVDVPSLAEFLTK